MIDLSYAIIRSLAKGDNETADKLIEISKIEDENEKEKTLMK